MGSWTRSSKHHVAFQSHGAIDEVGAGRKKNGGPGCGVVDASLNRGSIIGRPVTGQTAASCRAVVRERSPVPQVRSRAPRDRTAVGRATGVTRRQAVSLRLKRLS